MQRKNSLLRDGMAMIMAVAVLVIIGTILALSLSLTTQTTKKTTDLYLYEQAAILSHSAAEYAMLKMSQANPCSLKNIDFRYNSTYDVNATMKYISIAGSDCESNATASGVNYGTTTYSASNGSVILDITVTANPTGTTEPIRYFRRTIQKL